MNRTTPKGAILPAASSESLFGEHKSSAAFLLSQIGAVIRTKGPSRRTHGLRLSGSFRRRHLNVRNELKADTDQQRPGRPLMAKSRAAAFGRAG